MIETIILYSHLLGLAALAGGLMSQFGSSTYRVTPVMLWGARWQLLSGLILAGLERDELNHPIVGAKLGVLLVVLAVLESRKQPTRLLSPQLYKIVSMLVAVVIFMALFVTSTET
ncbi:hypothetical protein IPG36_01390 [bacterium]|nr:MAG: hypothetical protein IPG36_01390 [bacterium]